MGSFNALIPAGNGGKRGVVVRVILTAAALAAYWLANILLTPVATLGAASQAGQQFQNSDTAFTASFVGIKLFGALGVPLIVLIALLIVIWWTPARRALGHFGVAVLLASMLPHPAAACYDKSDFTEAYTILPNETGFWIPDVGANKDNQAQFESEAYLNANRVALKRFIVPHAKLQGSGSFFDFYVPAGRLIIVDRTPFSREWVDSTDRGTSRRHEGFPCQSREGINITVGVSIGASVTEPNAAKYLYRFGVLAPVGDRTDPKIIFNSVYYSRKLADVMDDVGRKKVQTLVCEEITTRTFDKANEDAIQIMASVKDKVSVYFQDVGITLDFIGWADNFTFDPVVQEAVNRRYVATQDQAIAAMLTPYVPAIQALAAADALRAFGQRTDGHLPTTIVGLPPEIGPLMSTLLKSAAVSSPTIQPAIAH